MDLDAVFSLVALFKSKTIFQINFFDILSHLRDIISQWDTDHAIEHRTMLFIVDILIY